MQDPNASALWSFTCCFHGYAARCVEVLLARSLKKPGTWPHHTQAAAGMDDRSSQHVHKAGHAHGSRNRLSVAQTCLGSCHTKWPIAACEDSTTSM